ncbi:polysaccharide biosynthesis protein [Lentibacillus sp. N15]|uniref:putative polysaccharide biosynthesis protein n=1 Tax=Lentibacillus songyuanensis TaxID=3136161 RepID=UPI0031BB4E69
MEDSQSKRLVKGALMLTVAGFISKLLSAGYRIPLQNMTGDLGFYIYQQIYPFLGIVLVLSLYGFPSAISKVVVDLRTANKGLSFTSFYVPIFIILCIINGAITLFLFLKSGEIAQWMGNARLETGLKLSAFAFLLIPFTALFRGVFQGNFQMKPTAVSQVGEQFMRVFIIILAAAFIAIRKDNIYHIGPAAAIASIAGGMVALMLLIGSLRRQKPIGNSTFAVPWSYYLKTMLLFGVFASLNHMVLLFIQFADAFTLVPGLVTYGLTQLDAMELKGVFDRGQPLIQLGTVIGSSFALALIPSISRQRLQADPEQFYFYVRTAMKCSIYLAVGATIGLVMVFPEANMLLFQDFQGTGSLRILVIAILLCSVAITAASILQGLGYIKRTALYITVALVIKWMANLLLVPSWEITGSALATVISLSVLCGFVLVELKRKLPGLLLGKGLNYQALCTSGLGMVIYLLIAKYIITRLGLHSRIGLLIYVMVIALTGAIVYLTLLIKRKAFTKEELRLLPFSSLFIRILPRKD